MKRNIIIGATATLALGSVLYFGAGTKTSLEDQIRAELLAGNVPTLDTSKYSQKQFMEAYVNVAKSAGVDFTAAATKEDYNLYTLTRDAEVKKGSTVLPSKDINAEAKSAKDI